MIYRYRYYIYSNYLAGAELHGLSVVLLTVISSQPEDYKQNKVCLFTIVLVVS